ncbi:hypothetical protein AO053_05720 [Haemophilus influenzae biotype aegyptius]|uniref:Phage protein n=1 Tax=Haemophilus influenzae F3047 TaxID=935897 RepID=A0AAV2U320_HAEIF|nr:hypothetical protein [Haemophilus influenzae]QEQ58498.1 hypothetical protein F1541_04655 [Haemophilus influenzae biotype aegyptius]QEQ61769.1 hypothetical protein F1539_04965 [Haemophilus influenzae biotype aegyptius]QEQ64421.1 hypothetical protein F1538_09490 [Haemophilus influenzae biotype aegyptius]QEQ65290.1 hypothetical protein F1537_04130 [Haemophilus influenzae biotype aegyptius]TMQ36870.1 hypothetical protein AO051_07790 [Haemophilus influenzae biotype aegyptius]
MKVYFLKENLNSYQIFPIPQNLNDFVEMEVENESELETKQLIDFKSQYILVDRQPTELHKWNGNSWVVDKKKKTEIKRELIKNLVDSIDDTAASISAKWNRFAEEYKERESAALAFKEANFTGEVSIYISSFATVAGLDNKSATLLILKQAEGLRTLQEQLAVQRMRKYELKHEELSEEELQQIHNDIIRKMKALTEVQQ